MESFQLMMEAGNYLPSHVKPWTYWMQLILFLGPIVFIRYSAAQIMLLTQVLNTGVAYGVFVAEGDQVTRLFGLGHFFWLWPAVLFYFAIKKPDLFLPYRMYAAVALITVCISLVFDVRDTFLWIGGDRGSVLVDVPVESPLYR